MKKEFILCNTTGLDFIFAAVLPMEMIPGGWSLCLDLSYTADKTPKMAAFGPGLM